jgi:F0F1-type ATP synthase membrane subunit b/b'
MKANKLLKYDLQLAEQSLRALIEQVRGELRKEIEEVRGELKAEIQQVKGELKAEIQQVKADLLKWLIVLFIGQATFIVGLVFTLLKLLNKT